MLTNTLKKNFDRWLDEPADFTGRMAKGKSAYPFPEAQLTMCVFSVLAYAASASSRHNASESDTLRSARLCRLAHDAALQYVHPPDGNLINLADYERNAVPLGLFNLALSAHLWASGSHEFEPVHRHLSNILSAALLKTRGKPLWSYPQISWPFDSLAVVLSLWLHDQVEPTQCYKNAISAHLDWLSSEGLDPTSGLPWSMVPMDKSNSSYIGPRGCAISLTLAWLWPIAPERVERWYRQFLSYYWQSHYMMAGFREWPKGQDGGADIDSGPIVAGFGLVANVFALSTSRIVGDSWRSSLLRFEMISVFALIKGLHFARKLLCRQGCGVIAGIPLQPDYVTGFLFGDACLFMTLTLPDFLKKTVSRAN